MSGSEEKETLPFKTFWGITKTGRVCSTAGESLAYTYCTYIETSPTHTHIYLYIAYELQICSDFSYTFTLFNEYKETIHSEDAYLSYEKKRV